MRDQVVNSYANTRIYTSQNIYIRMWKHCSIWPWHRTYTTDVKQTLMLAWEILIL